MSHTPGPWVGFHGDAVYSVMPAGRRGEVAAGIKKEEDARLIVAAPDMLGALKRALFVLESPAFAPYANGGGTVDHVRAVIAKAEGKCTMCNPPELDPDRRRDAKRNGDVPEFWENWPHDDE